VGDEAVYQLDPEGIGKRSLLATLSEGDLHHTSGNDGSGERGTEEVDVLVDGVTLNGGWLLAGATWKAC